MNYGEVERPDYLGEERTVMKYDIRRPPPLSLLAGHRTEKDLDIEGRDQGLELVGQHLKAHGTEIVRRITKVTGRGKQLCFSHGAHADL